MPAPHLSEAIMLPWQPDKFCDAVGFDLQPNYKV